MRWIDRARDIAKCYRKNCEELKRIREAETALPSRQGGRNGKISKPVEAAVERRMVMERRRYLEQSIAAVDFAMETVLQKPNGAVTVQLFNMVYWEKSHTLEGASLKAGVSYETGKRYNKYFLKMVAADMGFLNYFQHDTF